MKDKRGFTLVELLATITILGIISSIAVVSVTKYLEQAKKSTYADLERTVYEAARNYLIDHPEELDKEGEKDRPTVTVIPLDVLIKDEKVERIKDPNEKEQYLVDLPLAKGDGFLSHLEDSSYVAVFRYPNEAEGKNLNLYYKVCLRGASFQERGGDLSLTTNEVIKEETIRGCLRENGDYKLATQVGE